MSEELPDDSEDQLLLSVDEIDSSDVGEGDLELLGDFKGVVGVLDLDDSALSGLGDFLPVDDSWSEFIFELGDIIG